MKFQKKAVQVELVQFTRTGPENGYVRARSDGTFFVWNDLHKSEIGIEYGDFINISTPGDYYPIKQHIVESTYDRL